MNPGGEMERFGPLLALSLAMATPGDGCRAAPQASIQNVLRADAEYRRAWTGPNLAAMAEAMTDDWTVIHANGREQGKAHFLAALGRGRVRFISTRLEDPVVRIFGAAAIITGRVHNRIESAGATSEGDLRLMAVYVCRDGKWRVAAEQATAIEAPSSNSSQR